MKTEHFVRSFLSIFSVKRKQTSNNEETKLDKQNIQEIKEKLGDGTTNLYTSVNDIYKTNTFDKNELQENDDNNDNNVLQENDNNNDNNALQENDDNNDNNELQEDDDNNELQEDDDNNKVQEDDDNNELQENKNKANDEPSSRIKITFETNRDSEFPGIV